ncbi:histidinol-phosphate transaminase [Orrella sp. JC864]|uniref:histidinol-phosphate transaminase n=1 Tax=Orrella sp. JC864 TaxID=3120298 RepID=UPI0012BC9DF1
MNAPRPADARVRQCVQRTVRADVQALRAYAVAPAGDCIKLDAMECPYPLPAPVRAELAQALAQVDIHRYPAASNAALQAQVRQAFGVPQQAGLLFGNGSDELIHLLVQTCCAPGEAVLSPWPSFVYFEMAARLDHARFVGVPLTADFQIDPQALLAAIAREQPKVVFLAVPNNPTGSLWPDEVIEQVLQAAPGLVVVDEAYQPFAGRSWMPRLMEHPNLVVLRTVSKIGLAGLRFGYLAGHPAWVAELDKARPPYNIDLLTQAALTVVLRHKAVLDEQAARLVADREPLARALAALPGVTVFPSAGNFVLLRVAGAQALHRALAARRILVRDFSSAHPLLADCLRVSVGTPDENAALLAALQDLLNA